MVMKALLLVVPLLGAAPVRAIVLCDMPDGKKYAGDNPPADCEVKGRFENTEPRPPSAEEIRAAAKQGVEEAIEESAAERDASFLASAIRERRQIEREIRSTEDKIRRGGHSIEEILRRDRRSSYPKEPSAVDISSPVI